MKLPTILAIHSSREDELVLDLQMPSEVFEGHFRKNPILPGVVQIDWAIQIARQYLSVSPSGRKIQVKFRNIIRPDMAISLTLRRDLDKKRLQFSFKSGDDIMSSGQLKLEGA